MVYNFATWGYFSALALLLWVPMSLWFFSRERPVRAAAHTLIWGMMWLPEAAGFDLPILPPLGKYEISAIAALMGLWWKAPRRLRLAKMWRGYDILLIAMLLATIGTVANNSEQLMYGQSKVTILPPFLAYDGLYIAFKILFTVGAPLWIGRALLRSRQDLLDVLEILAVAGVIYSIPILYELRMSPMLHANVYGFVSRDDWQQNMRAGGFRATVFMGHGLVVSMFMFMALMSSLILQSLRRTRLLGMPMWVSTLGLFVMLLLCKSAGSFIYGVIGLVFLRWFKPKNQVRMAAFLAVVVVSYPLTRMFDIFPAQGILDLTTNTLGAERAQSLQFRFDNEDMLLIKGSEKLWFGWGGFGRDRVYDAYQGKDISVQDGFWILTFGQKGVVGFLCYFGLTVLPIFVALRRLRYVKRGDAVMLGGLALMVGISSANLLPNMEIPSLQLIFAMGLAVLTRELPRQAKQEQRELQQYMASQQAPVAVVEIPEAPRPRGRGLVHVGA
jgi:hypothetical protein